MAVIFEDQLVPDKTLSQILSTNWVDQCQCVQTVELLQSSGEWKLCAKMMESMQVRITNHKNSEHVVMGGLYLQEDENLQEKLELSMKCSFFMVLVVMIPSKWHVGRMVWIYDLVEVEVGDNLSESALYADKFAHHSTSDEKEIIIAKALIGELFD